MVSQPIRVALVGYGRWGPNLARNLEHMLSADLVAICDPLEERRAASASLNSDARRVGSLDEVLGDPSVEAVVIATPPRTHASLAVSALEAGKHVMVEKPLAMSLAECDAIGDAAVRNDRTLMVGHTFLYHPAIRWLRGHIDKGVLGSIVYAYSQRLNLGQVRADVDVMWSLAPHDVSMLIDLFGEPPVAVRAGGLAWVRDDVLDVGFATLEFSNGAAGHIHVSWLDPRKVRSLTVVGSESMVVFDDMDPEARVRVYDHGIDRFGLTGSSITDSGNLGEHQAYLRSGDLLVPTFDYREPLRLELEEFIEAIGQQRPPRTGFREGRAVVEVLEAVDRSITAGGERVRV